MEAARMFDGSWLAFSSHGTHAVVLLTAFQGETQNAENKRVQSSMKYSLPIGSVVFAHCWGAVSLMQPHSSGVDHPCIRSDLLALARNAAAWQIIQSTAESVDGLQGWDW
ncbi:hypothetical protein MBLNU13_g00261t2 [Cladosporium sp. NU13]